MKTVNYTQFAKKTLLLGMDKGFLSVYVLVIGIFYIFFAIFSINTLLLIVLAIIGYIVCALAFAKNPYWFDKLLIRHTIKTKYKFYKKTGHILSR